MWQTFLGFSLIHQIGITVLLLFGFLGFPIAGVWLIANHKGDGIIVIGSGLMLIAFCVFDILGSR